MIVVADTSPLNYLIRLGHPNVLYKIYGRVLVPRAVLIEMQHPEAPTEVRVWASTPPPWLEERLVEQLDESLAAEVSSGRITETPAGPIWLKVSYGHSRRLRQVAEGSIILE